MKQFFYVTFLLFFGSVAFAQETKFGIKVTEKTPMIMPKAVRIDRVLFAYTADKDILKFSKKSVSINNFVLNPQLFFHQTI